MGGAGDDAEQAGRFRCDAGPIPAPTPPTCTQRRLVDLTTGLQSRAEISRPRIFLAHDEWSS